MIDDKVILIVNSNENQLKFVSFIVMTNIMKIVVSIILYMNKI